MSIDKSSESKASIWDKTDGLCAYCGCKLNPWRNYSIDHILPTDQGGTDSNDNLIPSCQECNNARKSNTYPTDFPIRYGKYKHRYSVNEEELIRNRISKLKEHFQNE